MFRVKICGLTDPEDAQAAVEAGADALGLNFYHKSPRVVTIDRAIEVVHEENIIAQRVGVFVNLPAEEVNRVAQAVGLAWVQLHGNERPELLVDIAQQFKIIRVYRIEDDEDPEQAVLEDLSLCDRAGRMPDAVLIDAATSGDFGGTGRTTNWSALVDHRRWLQGLPLILAGGLQANNVAEAIALVQPAAVDVASGVEESPGRKCPAKMAAFLDAAATAFADLDGQ